MHNVWLHDLVDYHVTELGGAEYFGKFTKFLPHLEAMNVYFQSEDPCKLFRCLTHSQTLIFINALRFQSIAKSLSRYFNVVASEGDSFYVLVKALIILF